MLGQILSVRRAVALTPGVSVEGVPVRAAKVFQGGDRFERTLLPGQEVTTTGGHAGALGEVGWVDFRLPTDSWLEQTERHGGLLSVNHPIGGHVSWTLPMRGRPPLVEVWHWSWLDPRWTAPLAWWLAWDPGAIPVGGSDWHRPGADAPPGTPTTWVECAGDGPDAVLDGLRHGRVAISARRDGPVLLRSDGGMIAVDAEGTTLAGPDGPLVRVQRSRQSFPATAGYHRDISPGLSGDLEAGLAVSREHYTDRRDLAVSAGVSGLGRAALCTWFTTLPTPLPARTIIASTAAGMRTAPGDRSRT